MYLWWIAALAAYFIKGLCGFANTLVFTSILSFGAANANISPIDLLLGYPSNLILTWNNWRRLDPKVWLPLAALVLAGSIPGALLLKHVDARAIKLVFGVVVLGLGTEIAHARIQPKARLCLSMDARGHRCRGGRALRPVWRGRAAGGLCQPRDG